MNALDKSCSFVERLTVVFVVHGGELELKSAMLAASLRAKLGERMRIVAAQASPVAQWGELGDASRHLYRSLEIEVRPIQNPFGGVYPIGNKFAALALGKTEGHTLFLDSDMYCLRSPDFAELIPFEAALKPADVALVPTDSEYWRRLYALADAELQNGKVLASHSGDAMPTYFNAGLIWLRDAPRFAECWLDIAERIRQDPAIGCKWPWLDQLALPLALNKLGYRTRVLTERYNFPLHLKPLSAGVGQFLCHYHDFSSFTREPALLRDLYGLVRRWPELGEVLRQDPRWAQELAALEGPTCVVNEGVDVRGDDLVITGLPRSGTSYLCRLLSERADTVIINEPSQIFPLLTEAAQPWGLPRFYAELRRDLLAGRPVLNKHNRGRLVDDTARDGDLATPYHALVGNPSFTLGTKNTLAYLARLASIRKVMPRALYIGLIRHPYDSLASWARTFDHLRTAAVQEQPIGNPEDPGLTGWQRKALREIASTECLPVRRALWWRYLALQLLDAGEGVRWLRYEDLLDDPQGMVSRLVDGSSLPELSPVRWRGAMDEMERELVASVVCEVAERLQYIL